VCGNEPSDSIKGTEFLEYMSDYQLLRKECAPLCYLNNLLQYVQSITGNFLFIIVKILRI
jgi:hypothetical protein